MKVIQLLDKIAKEDKLPKKIKIYDDVYKYDEFYQDYVSIEDNDKFQESYNIFEMLNDKIEIIEEPKEELEEIEFAKAGDLMITIINELIKNQNKIIRELKANKEQ